MTARPEPLADDAHRLHGGPRWWAIPLLLVAVYGSLAAMLPSDVFWSPDQGGKLLQIESYRLDLQRPFTLRYGGRELDPGYRFYPRVHLYPRPTDQGRVGFNWPHLFLRVSWLPYTLFGVRGLVLLPLLAGVAAATLLTGIARRVEPRLAVTATVVAALASPLLVYSLLFWEHTTAVALCLAALWLLDRPETPGRAAWVSSLLVVATLVRLEALVFAAALLGAWLLLRWSEPGGLLRSPAGRRRVALGLAGLGVLTLSALWWLGDAGGVEQQASLQMFAARVRDRVFSTSFWSHLPSNVGWAWLGVPALNVSSWIPWRTAAALAILTLALGAAIPGGRLGDALALGAVALATAWTALTLLVATPIGDIRVRALVGLLLAAPSLVAIPRFLRLSLQRDRAARRLAFSSALLLAAATALATAGVLGGLQWGSRYQLVLYPLGALCAVAVFAHAHRHAGGALSRSAVGVLAGAVLVTSLLVQLRGAFEIRQSKLDLIAIRAAIERGGLPVVTDLEWLPGSLPRTFLDHPVFVLEEVDDFPAWLARRSGESARLLFDPSTDDLEDWLDAAAPTAAVEVGHDELVRGLRVVDLRFGGAP